MAKMREDIRENWGLTVPNEMVLTDFDDDFSFRTTNGTICGFTRNVETFWRGREEDNDKNRKA